MTFQNSQTVVVIDSLKNFGGFFRKWENIIL